MDKCVICDTESYGHGSICVTCIAEFIKQKEQLEALNKVCQEILKFADDAQYSETLEDMANSYYRSACIRSCECSGYEFKEEFKRIITKVREASKTPENTFICPWCGEEKPVSVQCSKGYCRSCSSADVG